jgi:tRNA A37 N6-isopentenylltransferase MiaA
MTTSNQHDHDIPVLTDIIDDQVSSTTEDPLVADDAELLAQIEEEITHRIFAELSVQIPLLIEVAMQKHVPLAVGAKLQAELMTALAGVIPAATAAASDQLVISIAQQLASDLDARLLEQVRAVVAEEFLRLQQ